MLPDPQIIRTTIEKVFKAFENAVQMELIRVRWRNIPHRNPTVRVKYEGVKYN